MSCPLLTRLGGGPKLVGHDPEYRHFARHPLRPWVQARHALSGVGILHVAQAIPHEPTDVELVVQNPGPAFSAPVNRARAPGAAEWACDAVSVQVLGDLL